jgi:hypothetical protein
MFDFSIMINIFYNLLKNNPDYIIIIEFIITPGWETHRSNETIFNKNYSSAIDNMNNLSHFINELGITNKIIFISNFNFISNIEEKAIFIENLHCGNFKPATFSNNILLSSRIYRNSEKKTFGDTIREIILKQQFLNNEQVEKKLFILEKRTNSEYYDKLRGYTETDYNTIKEICQTYCNNNDLTLVIWDDNLVKNNSIFQQFKISFNAEIMINLAGSALLFNYGMAKGKQLILGCFVEDVIKDMGFKKITYLTFYEHFINKHVQLYYEFAQANQTKVNNNHITTITNFLYNKIMTEPVPIITQNTPKIDLIPTDAPQNTPKIDLIPTDAPQKTPKINLIPTDAPQKTPKINLIQKNNANKYIRKLFSNVPTDARTTKYAKNKSNTKKECKQIMQKNNTKKECKKIIQKNNANK